MFNDEKNNNLDNNVDNKKDQNRLSDKNSNDDYFSNYFSSVSANDVPFENQSNSTKNLNDSFENSDFENSYNENSEETENDDANPIALPGSIKDSYYSESLDKTQADSDKSAQDYSQSFNYNSSNEPKSQTPPPSSPYTYGTAKDSSGNNSAKRKKNKDGYISKKSGIVILLVCVAAAFIFGFGGGIIGGMIARSSGGVNIQTAAPNNSASSSSVEYTGETLSIQEVASYAADSVVEITTEVVQHGSFMQDYVAEGAGSGVIISADGYIITNNHVISGASNIIVRLKNGTSYTATLIGTDSDYDVALLKVDAQDLKPVVFGDSSDLYVGQDTVAIGNPLGELGGTVTRGIISALDRSLTIDGMTMSVLQTDASINPGNSGGGLFNSKGELIGLVFAKSSGTDIEGLGFAIPSNIVKTIVEDLSNHGYVKGKPAMGVTLIDITSTSKARQYGVSQLGVYIYSVNEGSAAQAAGLAKGDCITAVDNVVVSSSTEVQQAVKSKKVGDVVTVTVLRNGKTIDLPVTLQESTPEQTTSQASSVLEPEPDSYEEYWDIDDFFNEFFGY